MSNILIVCNSTSQVKCTYVHTQIFTCFYDEGVRFYKLFLMYCAAEQAMKARKEIADYIKQKKIDRAKIRVRQQPL